MQNKRGLSFGIVGGITFALTWMSIHYYQYQEISYTGIAGGMAWFLTSWFFYRKKKK